MPRPVYIICANEITEDKTTNLVSVFTVVEQVKIQRIRNPLSGQEIPPEIRAQGSPPQFGKMKIIAVWMKQPGDEQYEFENEFVIEVGRNRQSVEMPRFGFSADKFLSRFTLVMHGFPIPDAACIAQFSSRVRRVGDQAWVSQDYPLPVEVIDVPQEQAAAEQPAANQA